VHTLAATAHGLADGLLPRALPTHLVAVSPFDLIDSGAPAMVWLVVLSLVFLECALIIGLFLPGDSMLFAAGVVLAAHDAEVSAWGLAVAATLAAIGGNQVGFLLGRRTGTRILARKGGRILNRKTLNRANAFFDRWGFWSVTIARWLPWIRTLAPMIAGAARMENRRFLLANSLGALLWVPELLLLGYYGAGLLDAIPWIRTATTVCSVVFFLAGTGYGVYRYRQEMRKPIDEEPVGARSER
jgi:membrane-associated protein